MGDEIQNTPTQDDLLEKLLAGAADAAAKKATQEALTQGVVSRNDFNTALAQMQATMKADQEAAIAAAVEAAVAEKTQELTQKGAGRKGTIAGGSNETVDPREDNPVKYLVSKARQKNEKGLPVELDEVDKALAWAMTLKGLTAGMTSTEDLGE